MFKRFSLDYALFSFCMDVFCVIGAFMTATQLRQWLPFGDLHWRLSGMLKPSFYLIALVLWTLVAFTASLYDTRKVYKVVDEFQTLTITVVFFSLAVSGFLYFTFRNTSRLLIIYALLMLLLMVSIWRLCIRLFFRLCKHRHLTSRRVLIVGAGVVGQRVAEMVQLYAWTGLELVGYLDDDPEKLHAGLPILGQLDNIREVVEHQAIDDIVLALPSWAYERMNYMVSLLQDLPVRVRVIPDYFSLALYRATVDDFGGIPMINLRASALNDYQRLVKRSFDLVLGSCLTLTTLPLMGMIALAIKLDSPGPVLFRQQRVGENGRIFEMYKFRSMYVEKQQHKLVRCNACGDMIHKFEDDPRVTRVGTFIRRWSLDELPQFFNVLKGDLSLVGPRPELPWLVARYAPWQRERFAVPQGLTGWWQVNGRADKVMHLHTDEDLYYVRNYSLWLDIYILLKTPFVVVRGKGAY
jgi:exopolysaccharide biosynthesis polyprenyl glycosylphosphotransferase